jgi:copper chaperone CopZ
MTCTGCETKLNQTLVTLPAVKDLKTSLVLSRAEFDINLRLSSVEQVIKHLERTTEFKCERVQSQGSSVEEQLNYVEDFQGVQKFYERSYWLLQVFPSIGRWQSP